MIGTFGERLSVRPTVETAIRNFPFFAPSMVVQYLKVKIQNVQYDVGII